MGSYLTLNGQNIHSDCFRCNKCKNLIKGEYIEYLRKYYHTACYQSTFGLKCDVCHKTIDGHYYSDVWGNKSHTHHNGNKTVFCFYCNRILSSSTSKGSQIKDGKQICGFCLETIVNTNIKIKKVEKSILILLSLVGFKQIPHDVSIELVEQSKLNKLANDYSNNIQGLASTEYRNSFTTSSIKHTIYILNNLPEVVFKGVLAHEYIHIWVRENQVKLSLQEEEGLCNLGSYLIYKNDPTPFGGNLLKQMEFNPDIIYGDGYRKMKDKLKLLNWKKLIEKVK